jgi:hypothetical protein
VRNDVGVEFVDGRDMRGMSDAAGSDDDSGQAPVDGNGEARKQKAPVFSGAVTSSGGRTRTDDPRIMIPLL